jgi:hypothetical protein
MKSTISRNILEQSTSWIRRQAAHTVERWNGWWEVSAKPAGVPFRAWLPFFRARLVCLVRGHVAPALLHRQAQTAQFPRARA